MKLVIDIPEEVYKKAKETHDAMCDSVWLGIKYGIPLPKRHGRLIDADDLIQEFSVVSSRPVKSQLHILREALTIIEADRGDAE